MKKVIFILITIAVLTTAALLYFHYQTEISLDVNWNTGEVNFKMKHQGNVHKGIIKKGGAPMSVQKFDGENILFEQSPLNDTITFTIIWKKGVILEKIVDFSRRTITTYDITG